MVGDVPPGLTKENREKGNAHIKVDALTVKGDRGETLVDNVGLSVSSGEILGIGGVAGNGQVELAEALVGIRCGSPLPRAAYIPEDRQRDGLALNMSIAENLLIEGQRLGSLAVLGIFMRSRITAWCEKIVAKFGIKTDAISRPANSLSGGNQQKVVVGRVLDSDPDFIVAVNPTRGLDVRAEHFVHTQLLAAKSRGAAVILFSTDLDELALLADRFLVMSKGKLLQGDNIAELMGGDL
jgi:simple sugar transport system ATP-binding protein